MQHPVCMQVVDAVKDLEEKGLDHAVRDLHLGLLPSLDRPVELYNMLGREGKYRVEWWPWNID